MALLCRLIDSCEIWVLEAVDDMHNRRAHKSLENPIPAKMRFLFPHALFHFPLQSLGIDLILFLLQPSCHELTSIADQADYNMSGQATCPTSSWIRTSGGEYRNFNLSMHSQSPLNLVNAISLKFSEYTHNSQKYDLESAPPHIM